MLDYIVKLNEKINGFVWGIPTMLFIIGIGLYFTLGTRFFQFTNFRQIIKATLGKVFSNKEASRRDEKNISQFQAFCTALAATIGVGNITGVASAIILGGPGAIFWMWISALVGMMTIYAENVLGVKYRIKNKDGQWCGGPMYYLRDGLGTSKKTRKLGKHLAAMFSVFCVLASFGMGNMSQINTISTHLNIEFNIAPVFTGSIITIIGAIVIFGGIKRITLIAEKIIPFLSIAYVIAALVICFANFSMLDDVAKAIVSHALGFRSLGGAAVGMSVRTAVEWGLKRGVFSNEAGIGSSVLIQSGADTDNSVEQGFWGILEVVVDTLVMCTLTAFVLLSSGLVDLETGKVLVDGNASDLTSGAFDSFFVVNSYKFGGKIIAVMVLFFAFATAMGWSCFGLRAWEYLYGSEKTKIYQVLFVVCMFIGSILSMDVVWDISDTFNGLMAIPNIIGLICLSKTVLTETDKYKKTLCKVKKKVP